MTSVLNFEALGQAQMQSDPFPFATYDEAFNEIDQLLKAFPTSGFEYHAQRKMLETLGRKGSEEWYQHGVQTRALLNLGETDPHEPEGLDDIWLQVANDLSGPEYRERLTEVTGFDVRPFPMQAHFWSFEGGASFKPHVDKPHKMVTHLMYLTENWQPQMGGCFLVLGSDDVTDARHELPPRANSSIVLRRTDNAWHSVTPIPRDERPRRLLQTWFWAD